MIRAQCFCFYLWFECWWYYCCYWCRSISCPLLLSNIDTDNNNDSDTVPSSCDPDEALQVCCFSTDSIVTTAASPTTSPIATAANSPTVYVQTPIFWLLIVLILLLMLMLIRSTSLAFVSITINWFNPLDPFQVPSYYDDDFTHFRLTMLLLFSISKIPFDSSFTLLLLLNDAFSQQLRIGRAVLWCLLLIYIIQSSVHPTIVPTCSWLSGFIFDFNPFDFELISSEIYNIIMMVSLLVHPSLYHDQV